MDTYYLYLVTNPTNHPNSPAAPRHPIALVAERTGLSRDVLRAWERRYGAVAPARSDGGQRLYSDDDIERFRLLAAATQHGRTISLVADCSLEELARLVAEDAAAAPAPAATPLEADPWVEQALDSIRALDGAALEKLIRSAFARLGMAPSLEELIPTLMQQVGERWVAGTLTIAQEHLASATVIGVVLDAVRTLRPSPGAPRLLVATPSTEPHAVGAALVAGIATLDGWCVTYLGPDVPAPDLVEAAHRVGARAVAVSVVAPGDSARVAADLTELRAALPASVTLILGGGGAREITGATPRTGISVCDSLPELRRVLAQAERR